MPTLTAKASGRARHGLADSLPVKVIDIVMLGAARVTGRAMGRLVVVSTPHCRLPGRLTRAAGMPVKPAWGERRSG